MGRQIKTTEDGKWQLYSTITESNIAEFDTETKMKKHIAMGAIYDAKREAIKTLMVFPYGFIVNDRRIMNDAGLSSNQKECYEWEKELLSTCDTFEEYYKKIDDKLNELLEQS